ncbi:methionine import ATP-binding protein MetN [Lysinibacillus alkalisoli]|uniref:Methionine import ATP-binding protein MetN n=1 Tax=Lysinibacillus alkalisoli TaxID=1911548 RepID=A0A917LJG1_9BACI|nr:methionine ABC transporter ATP-binding protein [Lysinibacillus alkalisoli]GGG31636.1 methionine import ATP-binding protein MetN [Lysinibacillus alkalisoli]
MIEVQDVSKTYGKLQALQHISVTIKTGEIFGMIGYSGAGKSTLLRCLNGLEQPTTGRIMVDGVEITAITKQQLRLARRNIGMIFQHFHLISTKTVFDNIAFSLKCAGKSKAEIAKRVPELLALVGLTERAAYYPAQLSGGQKQRVGIARALANEPTVLLCDEATSALDPTTTASILQLLKEINEQLQLTIVLITHEMEVVQEICHRVAVMEDGKIVEEGKVYDIFAEPQTKLAKQFVDTVHKLELPARLLQQTTGTIVRLTFRGARAEEAIISEAAAQFNVKINILHGQITYIQDQALGTLIVEIVGSSTQHATIMAWLNERIKHLEVLAHVA